MRVIVVFPLGNKLTEIKRGFVNHSGDAGVVGAIDCTDNPIQSPGGDMVELFRNRKVFFPSMCKQSVTMI